MIDLNIIGLYLLAARKARATLESRAMSSRRIDGHGRAPR